MSRRLKPLKQRKSVGQLAHRQEKITWRKIGDNIIQDKDKMPDVRLLIPGINAPDRIGLNRNKSRRIIDAGY